MAATSISSFCRYLNKHLSKYTDPSNYVEVEEVRASGYMHLNVCLLSHSTVDGLGCGMHQG